MQHKAGISKKLWTNSSQVCCRILISESTSTLLFPDWQQVPLDRHLPELQGAPPGRHLPSMRSCLDAGCCPIIHCAGNDCDSPGADSNNPTFGNLSLQSQRFSLKMSNTKDDCLLLRNSLRGKVKIQHVSFILEGSTQNSLQLSLQMCEQAFHSRHW